MLLIRKYLVLSVVIIIDNDVKYFLVVGLFLLS